MDLKQLLQTVFSNYPSRNPKEIQFKDNQLVKLLNKGLNGVDNASIFLAETFISKGSAGQGVWAAVPWIGLFDSDIASSAKKGFYIVYLFSADLTKAYLSLNQGWSFYHNTYGVKAGLTNISKVSKYWRHTLIFKTNRMSTSPIDLRASNYAGTRLPEGYERGNILSIEYEANKLPENSILLNDLIAMKTILEELKKEMYSPKNLVNSINFILTQSDMLLGEKHAEYHSDRHDEKQETVELTESPKEKQLNLSSTKPLNKIDYEIRQKTNSKTGFHGELLIMEYERQKLISAGLDKLAEAVVQVSKEDDSLGYDIRSYDTNKRPLFIEVKTTNGNIDTPFYLSPNELKKSNIYKDQYRLARVYKSAGEDKFYILKGDLSAQLDLHPNSFIAFPKYDV